MTKHKIYKLSVISNNSMLPRDPLGSPDESLHKIFKTKEIITNIQVPGMALWSNAWLPTQFIISTHNFWRGYDKSNRS